MYNLKGLPKLFDEVLVDTRVHKATKYVSEKSTIKVTRVGKPDKRSNQIIFKVTIGTPNYAERQFIKDCVKAKVVFPIGKIQLKYYLEKKK